MKVQQQLAGCDLVFADPDNGLCPDETFVPTRQESAKRLPLHEATSLCRQGRTVIIYHHNTRFPGGHQEEIRWWMSRMPGCAQAFYWRQWSCRTFFIVNPDRSIEERLSRIR